MKHFLVLGLALACSALTSCVSHPAMRMALEERDAEIRELRSERAQLRQQIQLLNYDKEKLNSALTEASMQVEAPREMSPIFPELDDLGIDYGTRNGDVVISLPAGITFASGKASLTDSGREALGAVTARLKREFSGSQYFVEGHTDNDPIRKSKFGSNRELSLARAMAVLTYLVEQGDLPDEDCVVVGHGEYMPIAPNDGPSNKAKNRRVEIVVRKP